MICWQDAPFNDFVDVRMIISNIFIMNQTTPHLRARSGLMNNEKKTKKALDRKCFTQF
jgi:hypothetical protein